MRGVGVNGSEVFLTASNISGCYARTIGCYDNWDLYIVLLITFGSMLPMDVEG